MKTNFLQFIVTLLLVASCFAQKNPDTGAKMIWSGEGLDFWTGDISPNGRYVSDIKWDTGDFQLLDLNTGKMSIVKGVGYDVGRYAWSSSFSSDGRRIAVSCYVNAANSHELRVTNV